jgi:hypothetical protein
MSLVQLSNFGKVRLFEEPLWFVVKSLNMPLALVVMLMKAVNCVCVYIYIYTHTTPVRVIRYRGVNNLYRTVVNIA